MSATIRVEHDAFRALPQLSAADLIPEVTSLRLDPAGRLRHIERRQPLLVTTTQLGRRLTGRLGFEPTVTLEFGCRLARLPYTTEAPEQRRLIFQAIDRIQRARIGRLGLTPRQELHLSDAIELGPGPLGTADLVHALVVVGLGLRPVLQWLDALPLPRP
jgi:hypothetical protein